MSIIDRIKNRVTGATATQAGERLLRKLEAEAAADEVALQARRRMVEEIEDARRRKREDLASLNAAHDRAVAAHIAARDAERVARRARGTASHDAESLRQTLQDTIGRCERALIASADERIRDALATVTERLGNFPQVSAKVRKTCTETVLLEPDESDPDAWWMSDQGARYITRRFGTNEAGVEAIHRQLEQDAKALRALALLAEPPENLEEQIAHHLRWCGQIQPPDMVWTEPKAPTYTPAEAAAKRERRSL